MRRSIYWALFLGGLLTLLTVVLYFLVIWNFPWASAYTDPETKSVHFSTALNTWLAFGQVYIGFLSILIASSLGYLAIQEFRKAQQTPQLSILFHPTLPETQALSTYLVIPRPNHPRYPETYMFHLAIRNDGTSTTFGFTFNIQMPFISDWINTNPAEPRQHLFNRTQSTPGQTPSHPHIKMSSPSLNTDQWSIFSRNNVTTLVLNAYNEVSIYPNTELMICEISIPSTLINLDEVYTINYNIYPSMKDSSRFIRVQFCNEQIVHHLEYISH